MRNAMYKIAGCLVVMLLIGNFAPADDWPQLLGPRRNGSSTEKMEVRLPSSFSPQWQVDVGQGYAGPVIVAGKVLLNHRLGGEDVVDCRDAKSGRVVWSQHFPATYGGGIDADTGPRCVPLVAQDRIFTYSAAGALRCLRLDNGKLVWERDLARDLQAPDGYFGAGSGPILIGDRLLLNVGGKKGGIVACDANTGTTVFTVPNQAASYSSPTIWKQGAEAKAIFVTRLNVVEVDPRGGIGRQLFPFGRTGPTVNAAVPLVHDDHVFVTASYGVGAKLVSLAHPDAAVWENDDSLSSQYATPVLYEGYLYGCHGREDIPPAHYRCVEWKTGRVAWSRDDFGVAHSLLVNGKLLLLTVSGELVLVSATPEKYHELGRLRVSNDITRSLPGFSNGHFYFRTNAGGSGKLVCLTLEAASP